VKVQVDLEGVNLGQEGDQVLQRAAKPVDRPRHDHVELPLGRVRAQLVELRAFVSALGAADNVVTIDVRDFAPHPLGNLPQLALLIGGGLIVG
jgi:hypothetical protein